MKGLGLLAARAEPWLFEVGSWIFGGLLAFNLVLVSALITVGPADDAILISITALACALPLEVAGMCVVRFAKDARNVGIDDLTLQSFKDAGFPDIEAYFPPAGERDRLRARRSAVALRYSLGIGSLSMALTALGLLAALWYMAWWACAAALAAALLSTVLVVMFLMSSQPAASRTEENLKRHYAEQRRRRGS